MKIFIISIFLASSSLFAKDHTIKVDGGGVIVFETVASEKSQRNFFGADLWFVGEKRDSRRNVMSVTSHAKGVVLDPNISVEGFKKHKLELEKYAREKGYSKVEIKPYKNTRIRSDLSYHSFSWSYQFNEFTFIEQSYYVECNNLFFIAKATTFLDSTKDQIKFKNIIEGVKCTN